MAIFLVLTIQKFSKLNIMKMVATPHACSAVIAWAISSLLLSSRMGEITRHLCRTRAFDHTEDLGYLDQAAELVGGAKCRQGSR
jgi:hypothetical protein